MECTSTTHFQGKKVIGESSRNVGTSWSKKSHFTNDRNYNDELETNNHTYKIILLEFHCVYFGYMYIYSIDSEITERDTDTE